MYRKATFALVALFGVLIVPFADCVFAATRDQGSMQCYGSMPCDPSNQSHDCCKSMGSSQSPSAMPTTCVSLHAPVGFVAGLLPSPFIPQLSESTSAALAASQHSPPELYTLHSSFLI